MADAELARLVSASLSLLGLGLVMGFSPTLYGLTLHFLTRSGSASRDVLWLSAGIAAGASVLFTAFRAFDPETLTDALRGDVEELFVRRGVDLTAGVLFLVLAGIIFVRSRKPAKPSPPAHRLRADGPRRIFLLGFANTVIGVSGIATMYVTGRVVTGATESLLLRLALYGVFLITLLGPYVLAAWAWQRFPRVSAKITAGYDWLLHRDLRPLFAIGALAAGLTFVGLGVWGHGDR